jgi:hypothetical protein
MWVDIPTFVDGQVITASHFYVYLRDNLRFLYQPPMCRAVGSGNARLPAAMTTLLDFPNVFADTDGMHGGAVGLQNEPATGLITVNTDGIYMHQGRVDFQDSLAGFQEAYLGVRANNGSGWHHHSREGPIVENSGGPNTIISIENLWALGAGGQFSVQAYASTVENGEIINEYNFPMQYVHWMGNF